MTAVQERIEHLVTGMPKQQLRGMHRLDFR